MKINLKKISGFSLPKRLFSSEKKSEQNKDIDIKSNDTIYNISVAQKYIVGNIRFIYFIINWKKIIYVIENLTGLAMLLGTIILNKFVKISII